MQLASPATLVHAWLKWLHPATWRIGVGAATNITWEEEDSRGKARVANKLPL